MKKRSIRAWLLAGILLALPSPATAAPSPAEIRTLAEEAYIFGYPLVLMDATEKVLTVPPLGAPVDQFFHMREFPSPSFTEVVSPNADTLYSSAWLDLSKEPIVLSKPATFDRYYLLPMLDAWTNVFDSLSPRTATTAEGHFAIVGPGWKGAVPDGLRRIDAPTDTVWIIGRTYTNGKSDYPAVHKIQDGYTLTPLSAWGKPYTPPAPSDPGARSKKAPVDAVAAMKAPAFFAKLAELMKKNPPAAADAPMVAKLAQLGIVPGQPFDPQQLGSGGGKALQQGVDSARAKVIAAAKGKAGREVNGWSILTDLGAYGTNYLRRAAVAWFGLGANLPNDAIYPKTSVDAEGKPLNGANRYVLHFDKGELPPAMGFWSVTMYNQRQFFVANPIDRYSVGDRDLKTNADGSLDIYIQKDAPGADKESNWLPSPKGDFNLIMRLYYPMQKMLDGSWTPPPVKRVP